MGERGVAWFAYRRVEHGGGGGGEGGRERLGRVVDGWMDIDDEIGIEKGNQWKSTETLGINNEIDVSEMQNQRTLNVDTKPATPKPQPILIPNNLPRAPQTQHRTPASKQTQVPPLHLIPALSLPSRQVRELPNRPTGSTSRSSRSCTEGPLRQTHRNVMCKGGDSWDWAWRIVWAAGDVWGVLC
ncbi:hypothetical protein IQ07DRAFT_349939 [Pyrenochaeta sp. DS3sAY3a]|nr:hypothetical protein IQ07DRAFT_349939 [Pyrenochaeta sp. DS3sAY3a]